MTPDIHDLIRQRTSGRAFTRAPLPEDAVCALLEAARWAPSWGNLQPWRFVVVTDPAVRAAMESGFTRGNAWAMRAPALIVVASNPNDGKYRGDEPYYLFDCGLATQCLIIEAARRGLVAHPFGGWDEPVVRAAIDAPEDVRIVVLIAVGMPGSPEDLDERARQKEDRPHERKPLAELVYADRWAQLAPFLAEVSVDRD